MAKMASAYQKILKDVTTTLERASTVKAPIIEYLGFLETAQGELEVWFEASIEAAKDDIRRQNDH